MLKSSENEYMVNVMSWIHGIKKRNIDIIRTLQYTRKWPSDKGRFIVSKKTYIDASKNNLKRYGEVHIGCPKGIFGYLAIPGDASTLIKIDANGQLYLNNDVYIYAGAKIIISSTGKVFVGANTSIASNTYILSRNEICIGNDCAISWDCQIMDTDFHEVIVDENNSTKSAPVIIGNHVLVCSKVSILKGVVIGDNAVIAANSVVTKDVPAGCIVAGNPAQVIRKNVNWK